MQRDLRLYQSKFKFKADRGWLEEYQGKHISSRGRGDVAGLEWQTLGALGMAFHAEFKNSRTWARVQADRPLTHFL